MAGWLVMCCTLQYLTLTQALHHSEASLVVVYNDWNTTIRTQFGEPLLLLDVLANVDGLPGIVLMSPSVPILGPL